MNDYFRARKRYRRNIIIGIAVCLYLWVFQTQLSYQIFAEDWGAANTFWPLCMVALYWIFAKIRKKGGKKAAYTGRLRIIPKVFITYMLFCSLIAFSTIN